MAQEPNAIEALAYLNRSYVALGKQEEARGHLLQHIENTLSRPMRGAAGRAVHEHWQDGGGHCQLPGSAGN